MVVYRHLLVIVNSAIRFVLDTDTSGPVEQTARLSYRSVGDPD
jgi:hypothetical protein